MKKEGTLNYYVGDSCPVRIHYYRNPWHSRNYYIKMELEYYDIAWAEETFAYIRKHITAPLQIMLSSDEWERINFILAAGFELKRRCFELAVSCRDLKKPLQDKISPISNRAAMNKHLLHCQPDSNHLANVQLASGLHLISRSTPQYHDAVSVLYEHYLSTHESINPLTVEVAEFSSGLPHHVIIDLKKDSLRHLAFIEENEIAYVASTEPEGFSSFADRLLSDMFSCHQEIVFEADDLDPMATELRLKFRSDGKASYDTYIRFN